MAATPAVDYDRLIFDLQIQEAIFEHLFNDEYHDGYRIRHIELTPTEYAGLFEEHDDWHINIRERTEDCLQRKGLDRVMNPTNSRYVRELYDALNNNKIKPTTNINYNANTEGNRPAPTRPLVERANTKTWVTPTGDLKLPKFKRHSIYQKYPWLHSFRSHGSLRMFFFNYKNEYLADVIPPTQVYGYGYGNDPYNMNGFNQDAEEVWDVEYTYVVLVPYGAGYASLFIVTPDPVKSEDMTDNVIQSVRGCAAQNATRAPVFNTIPRGARTVKRLGLLKSLPKQLPTNVFRSHIMPLVGNEHLGPVPRRRKARKTRKYRK